MVKSMLDTSKTATAELVMLEDLTTATTPVAMLKQEPSKLSQDNANLIFQLAYDGLDYLDFAALTLPSGDDVALVRHHGCPQSGTEIWVKIAPENSAQLIEWTCESLNTSKTDLVWIHPAIQT
jgi:hypothetical protein